MTGRIPGRVLLRPGPELPPAMIRVTVLRPPSGPPVTEVAAGTDVAEAARIPASGRETLRRLLPSWLRDAVDGATVGQRTHVTIPAGVSEAGPDASVLGADTAVRRMLPGDDDRTWTDALASARRMLGGAA